MNSSKHQNSRRNRHAEQKGRPLKVFDKIQTLLDEFPNKENLLLLVLDRIQDPHNLGAILRTAEGAGGQGVIITKHHSVGITETVRNISVGAADRMSIVKVSNLHQSLKEMSEQGIHLIGMSNQASKSLYKTNLKGPVAFVLGAEGEGMRRLTKESCDELVSIPMAGQMPCLNVSVTVGICLYEAVRQRML